MAHLYEVHTNDGRTHEVPTTHHHSDHDEATFKRHLLDVLKGTASGVASNIIVSRFIYRGRR